MIYLFVELFLNINTKYSLVALNKLRYPLRNPKIELQILNFITEQKNISPHLLMKLSWNS